jgi:hypothetical protein
MFDTVEVIQVRRDRLRLLRVILLIAAGLSMVAASVLVLLGEKGVGPSESLWNVAVDLCRVVTGLLGLLAIKSAVPERRAESSRQDTFWTVVSGVVFIAAAVAGLRLVIVMTGLAGLVLIYAGGALAVDAFRSRHHGPAPTVADAPSCVWPEARCNRHGSLDPVGDPRGVVPEIEPNVAVLVVDPREPLVDDLDNRDVAVGG